MRVSGGLRKTPFQDWDGGVRGCHLGSAVHPCLGFRVSRGLAAWETLTAQSLALESPRGTVAVEVQRFGGQPEHF